MVDFQKFLKESGVVEESDFDEWYENEEKLHAEQLWHLLSEELSMKEVQMQRF